MAKALFSDVLKFLETHSETHRLKVDDAEKHGSILETEFICFEFEKFCFTVNLNVEYLGYYDRDLKEYDFDVTSVSCDILEIYDPREEEYLQFSKSEIADLEQELSTSLNIELYKL